MKKMFLFCLIAGLTVINLVLLSGCVTTSTYTKKRVDQKVSGNQGYIMGTVPPSEKTEGEHAVKERTIMKVSIELPPYLPREKYEREDKELTGNRGYLEGESKEEEQVIAK